MNIENKSITSGAFAIWALLGLNVPAGLADEQPAPAGEQPAAPGGEQPPSAVPSPVSMLGMAAGSLTTNPNPISFDLGPLGTTYFSGVVSGLGLWENNPFP